jgi:hypothetical protein
MRLGAVILVKLVLKVRVVGDLDATVAVDRVTAS